MSVVGEVSRARAYLTRRQARVGMSVVTGGWGGGP